MAAKIINVYFSLTPVKRLLIIISVLLLLITGSVVAATAFGGISFSAQGSAPGSVVATAKPEIGVKISSSGGVIAAGDVQMSLDDQPVTPGIVPAEPAGTYNVSFRPQSNLNDGNHTVLVSVYDAVYGEATATNWSFNVDAAPQATGLSPADGAILDILGPKILVTVKDNYDNLDAASVSLKIDGTKVPATFRFKGYKQFDSCSGSYYYVVTSNKDGTIEYQTASLADGKHTAELSIADVNGNVLNKQWSFTVGTKPVFSELTPANASSTNGVSGISVKVADNTGINPGSIVVKVNNAQVNHTYDAATGLGESSVYCRDRRTASYGVKPR